MPTTTQIVAASSASIVAAGLAYAVYFDYKRRHDSNFRKSLEKEKKRHRKLQKAAEEAQGEQEKVLIKAAVQRAQEEGFPTDTREKEEFFMEEVAQGELLLGQGPEKAIEAAMSFYKALKVYPSPDDLVGIYEKTVPKHVLDIIAVALSVEESDRHVSALDE